MAISAKNKSGDGNGDAASFHHPTTVVWKLAASLFHVPRPARKAERGKSCSGRYPVFFAKLTVEIFE